MTTMTKVNVDQDIELRASFKDSSGNDVPVVDHAPTWHIDETYFAAKYSADGMVATLTPLGPLGWSAVTASYNSLNKKYLVEVVPGVPVNLDISATVVNTDRMEKTLAANVAAGKSDEVDSKGVTSTSAAATSSVPLPSSLPTTAPTPATTSEPAAAPLATPIVTAAPVAVPASGTLPSAPVAGTAVPMATGNTTGVVEMPHAVAGSGMTATPTAIASAIAAPAVTLPPLSVVQLPNSAYVLHQDVNQEVQPVTGATITPLKTGGVSDSSPVTLQPGLVSGQLIEGTGVVVAQEKMIGGGVDLISGKVDGATSAPASPAPSTAPTPAATPAPSPTPSPTPAPSPSPAPASEGKAADAAPSGESSKDA